MFSIAVVANESETVRISNRSVNISIELIAVTLSQRGHGPRLVVGL